MRIVPRLGALAAVALALSACVAAPGASPDPSASAPSATAASAAPSAAPWESPAGRKVACPPLPLDPSTGAMVASIELLASLGDDAAPCFGTAKLQVTGYVPQPWGLGGTTAYTYSPTWLYGMFAGASMAAGRGQDAAGIEVYAPPSLGSCDGTQLADACVLHQYMKQWVTVVGHYNDPAASTCTATPIDATVPPIPAQDSELACLRHLVLESVAPFAATGPLPPVDPGLCPVEPITVDQLVEGTNEVGPQYGLGCLGGRTISFTAYVVPGVGLLSGMEQVTVEPRWLADALNTGIVIAESATAADDATGWLCPFAPYVGGYVTVSGHYDDPESLTCREVPAPGGPLLDSAALVLTCREQLVVTAVAPAEGPEPTATPPTTSTR
ncbi:MAG: hypothetical protein MUE82_11040 [Chloroflexi bacterium]|nr:hypothetical protein [Chloroflexota bacterium]